MAPTHIPKYRKIIPYFVLACLLALSVLVWQYYEKATREREERRFGEYADRVISNISERLDKHKMVLWGGAGVFAASEVVTREEWQAYYEYQEISTLYPGIRGVGFSTLLQPSELEQHIQAIKAEGFPGYMIRPDYEREIYAPIIFMEPFDEYNRRALGFDVFSEPVRRAAMERARDTGSVAISGKVDLVRETGATQPAFLMVAPVYTEGMPLVTLVERRAAIEGYVLGIFSVHDLLQGIFQDPVHKIDFYLYDGAAVSPDTLIYTSHLFLEAPEKGRGPLLTGQKTLDLYGHHWTVVLETTPAFEAAVDRYTPKGVLAAGLLISLLIFFYLRVLETTGDRALSLARQMTSALRESEKKYRFLTENISDIIWSTDLKGRFTYISPAIANMTGYTPEEIMRMPMPEYIVREDYQAVTAKLAEELAKPPAERDRTATIQARLKTKDDRLVHVELKATWTLDAQGNCIGVQGSTREITERKRLEDQLNESKRLYRSVVDTQQEMICRYLPDTTLTFVNDAYCRAFGKSRRELLGRKYLEFIPPEIHDQEIEQITSLTPAGPSLTQEYRVLLPDGGARWQEWTDYALFTEAGEIREIQGVGRDITERKQAEEEKRRQGDRALALLRSASRLNADLKLETVLHTVCEEVCAALHAPLSAFLLYDHRRRAFYIADTLGLPPEAAQSMRRLPLTACAELLQKLGKSGVIRDLASVPDLSLVEPLREHGVNSCVYAVMERDGSPVGVLIAGAAGDGVAFSEDAADLLAGLASQAASAVANARLYVQVQERLRQVQALRNIDMAITGSLDLRVTFQIVLDEVTGMLKTDAAAIMCLDPYTGMLKYEAWRGFRTKDLKSVNLLLGEGYGGQVAFLRQSVHISDLREVEPDPAQGPLMIAEGFAAYYAVPLIAKGTVRGVLEVFHRAPLDSNGDWLAFLETLGGQAAIAIDSAELFHKLERSNVDLLRAYDATIEGWARALDLKDEATEGHSRRVMDMTYYIARAMGIKDEELAHVRRGALLHDIGKMGIPDAVLLKPGKLTAEEWEVMRRHPSYAFTLLSPIDYLRPALDIPYCHHERWDGAGYPRGLKGEQIPLAARIFAVVDVFDACTGKRPYRPAWPREKALDYILRETGKHFDPRVVEIFMKMVKAGSFN